MRRKYSETGVFIAMLHNPKPERLFDNLGMTMLIVTPDSQSEFKAIIQPLRYKNKIYLNGVPTELGYDSMKKYMLLCSSRVELEKVNSVDTYLVYDTKRFRLDHCEKVYFKGKPFYYWAIVHREG